MSVYCRVRVTRIRNRTYVQKVRPFHFHFHLLLVESARSLTTTIFSSPLNLQISCYSCLFDQFEDRIVWVFKECGDQLAWNLLFRSHLCVPIEWMSEWELWIMCVCVWMLMRALPGNLSNLCYLRPDIFSWLHFNCAWLNLQRLTPVSNDNSW